MARYTIVVDRLSDWRWPTAGLDIVTADAFLTRGADYPSAAPRVINLCRRYSYLSGGYYCSLLAEARGQIPMPTVADILCFSRKSLYAFALPDLDETLGAIMRRLSAPPEDAFDLHVFFGRTDDSRFKRLAAEVFDIFRYPMLKLKVVRRKRWHVDSIRPLRLDRLPEDLSATFEGAVRGFTRTRGMPRTGRAVAQYGLAVLVDPEEALPPSDAEALQRFVRAGKSLRIDVEMITKRDLRRIPEFDALFIRTTTAIDHYTYQFARKAEEEGIPVIDDPTSILRCTNKVYMNERLAAHGLPTPRTVAVDRRTFGEGRLEALESTLGYPMVLKIPDGSFSRGVVKAEGREQLRTHAEALLRRSRIILAQEYMYTPFDWRVGVLNGEPLYVCQYMMSRNHWQIIQHAGDGRVKQGRYRTLAVGEAPNQVIETARGAAALMGDGLYGIDLKENERGVFVIEVNDNPSIEHGVEDKVLRGALYDTILKDFIRRIERGRGNGHAG